MRYFKLVSTLLFVVAIGSSLLAQQQRDVYANPKNLQVLTKDITPAELAGVMRRIKLALGVECSYCHKGTDNRSFSDFDFAAESKELRSVASLSILVSFRSLPLPLR